MESRGKVSPPLGSIIFEAWKSERRKSSDYDTGGFKGLLDSSVSPSGPSSPRWTAASRLYHSPSPPQRSSFDKDSQAEQALNNAFATLDSLSDDEVAVGAEDSDAERGAQNGADTDSFWDAGSEASEAGSNIELDRHDTEAEVAAAYLRDKLHQVNNDRLAAASSSDSDLGNEGRQHGSAQLAHTHSGVNYEDSFEGALPLADAFEPCEDSEGPLAARELVEQAFAAALAVDAERAVLAEAAQRAQRRVAYRAVAEQAAAVARQGRDARALAELREAFRAAAREAAAHAAHAMELKEAQQLRVVYRACAEQAAALARDWLEVDAGAARLAEELPAIPEEPSLEAASAGQQAQHGKEGDEVEVEEEEGEEEDTALLARAVAAVAVARALEEAEVCEAAAALTAAAFSAALARAAPAEAPARCTKCSAVQPSKSVRFGGVSHHHSPREAHPHHPSGLFARLMCSCMGEPKINE